MRGFEVSRFERELAAKTGIFRVRGDARIASYRSGRVVPAAEGNDVESPRDESPLILIVEDDEDSSNIMARWLSSRYQTLVLEDAESCLEELDRTLPAAVCLDLELPGEGGLDCLSRIRERYPSLPVVIITATREVETVVEALQRGAYDYLPKPLEKTKLLTTLRNAVEKHEMALQVARLERGTSGRGFAGIVGRSKKMLELYDELQRVATSDITVLIHGESGTGKELVARAIHDDSRRASKPFVAVNCAAIPTHLIESEFFGHEKGAFTGATGLHRGRLEQADGGTLFLDEVAELEPTLQAKLLRALQERRFHRVGGRSEISSDFRVISASHRDLATEAAEGRFREDLYFRLAVFEVEIPALRHRTGDIELLAEHFLKEYAEGPEPRCTDAALRTLRKYSWPGNVRELQNAMQRAAVVCRDERIEPADLPGRLRMDDRQKAPVRTVIEPSPLSSPPRLEEMERRALVRALERASGNVAQAARSLGIGRTTIYRKIKKYNIGEMANSAGVVSG